MFLRASTRKKDGKLHRYYSVVENKRVGGKRVVQRHVLYLGEINSSQERAWRRSIEMLDEATARPRTLALFAEDRCEGVVEDDSIVRLRLSELRLERPRQWGGCWLTLWLWQRLGLDVFWAQRLPVSRKGTHWDQVLFVLVAYRLLSPDSEWRLHRHWFEHTGLADLLGADAGVTDIHALYECHDRLLEHKHALNASTGEHAGSGAWIGGFPPRRCSKRCAQPIRRCITWWARPRGGSAALSAPYWTNPGMRRAPA
jgi:hypothetical protein